MRQGIQRRAQPSLLAELLGQVGELNLFRRRSNRPEREMNRGHDADGQEGGRDHQGSGPPPQWRRNGPGAQLCGRSGGPLERRSILLLTDQFLHGSEIPLQPLLPHRRLETFSGLIVKPGNLRLAGAFGPQALQLGGCLLGLLASHQSLKLSDLRLDLLALLALPEFALGAAVQLLDFRLCRKLLPQAFQLPNRFFIPLLNQQVARERSCLLDLNAVLAGSRLLDALLEHLNLMVLGVELGHAAQLGLGQRQVALAERRVNAAQSLLHAAVTLGQPPRVFQQTLGLSVRAW